jgi:hypothetical protein
VQNVHNRPSRVSVRELARGRQWTLASSGSVPAHEAIGAPVALSLASGDRVAQDHSRLVQRQLPDVLGVPLAVRDDGVIALLELLAERGDGGLYAGRILRGPLRERRVPGLVHSDESRHWRASWVGAGGA